MSHTVPSQQPAVVLHPNYQHLRTLLAVAGAVILGLIAAVAVLATRSNHVSVASSASPSAETGARLDHSGRDATVTQATGRLATYPDTPPPSARTPRQSVGYYLDGGGSAPQARNLAARHTGAGLNPTAIRLSVGSGLAWASIPKPDRIAAEQAAANQSASLDRFALIHVRSIPPTDTVQPNPDEQTPAAARQGDPGASNHAPKYTCVPDKFCIRVR